MSNGINFLFKADATEVYNALDSVKQKAGQVTWADFAIDTQAIIGMLGQAKSVVEGLVSSFLAPAAALEDASVKLGDELASSLERMATNGVISFQELQEFHTLNTEMSNTTKGSWETMLASSQKVLAEIEQKIQQKTSLRLCYFPFHEYFVGFTIFALQFVLSAPFHEIFIFRACTASVILIDNEQP